jgi:4-hydroxybenzoate polyprenyltransferase
VRLIQVFLIYSNIFIALCALALSTETFVLLKVDISYYWYPLLLFFCTLFTYSLHYYSKLKKNKNDTRSLWGHRHKPVLISAVIISAIAIAAISIWKVNYLLGLQNGSFNYFNLFLFISVPLLSLAYTHSIKPGNKKAIRNIGWLKMFFLSFIWTFTTTLLPILLFPSCLPVEISLLRVLSLLFHRFCFIASLSILFNIYDYEEDKAEGITTIAVTMGTQKILQLGARFTLLFNLISAVWLALTFRLYNPLYWLALLAPVLLLYLSFIYFKNTTDKAAFALRYDGMMIVKSLLLIFALLIDKH